MINKADLDFGAPSESGDAGMNAREPFGPGGNHYKDFQNPKFVMTR